VQLQQVESDPRHLRYAGNNLTKIEEEAGLSNDDDQLEVPLDDVGDARAE